MVGLCFSFLVSVLLICFDLCLLKEAFFDKNCLQGGGGGALSGDFTVNGNRMKIYLISRFLLMIAQTVTLPTISIMASTRSTVVMPTDSVMSRVITASFLTPRLMI